MKKLCAIAAVLLIVAMLASISVTAAEAQNYDMYLVIPEQHKGRVWSMPMDTNFDGVPDFNSKDIVKDSIVGYWFDEITGLDGYIYPTAVVTHVNSVEFHFNPNDLPAGGATLTFVMGSLKNGDTFVATGPGFTYIHH
jgi:hypothetical protein